jgi:CTP:molybdopterin cytidylyltransferase MocA
LTGVAVAVLAAGRSVRFGTGPPKQLIAVGGRPMIAHAVDAAIASGCTPVVVVVADDRVAAALPAGVDIIRNLDPGRGISSSLQCALRALEPRADIDAIVVGLGDQPLVGAGAFRKLTDAYENGARLAVATYGGTRGNPVLLARVHWSEALALEGDEGARALFRRLGVIEVPCDGTGDPVDVDTPDDLARVEAQWRSQTASE